jgi:thiamine kinase-like enzyme
VLAALHGSSWGKPFDGPLISFGSSDFKLAMEMLFSGPNWERTLNDVDTSAFPDSLKDREAILRGYYAMFDQDAKSEHCILHGDAHIGNTYRAADGQVYFIDWPTVCLGDWGYDVSYYISGSLTVADRRAHERDLLEHYLAGLHAAGGPRLEFDAAWTNYAKHQVRGIIWATLPSTSQPMNRVQPMADRYVAAMVDHDTLSLLG